MAKFFGNIGFATMSNNYGVFEETVVEKFYRGDILKASRKASPSDTTVHDELTFNMRVSIVLDAYLNDHLFAIRYVDWAGSLWKVTTVEIERPRLLLTIGGVYNGPRPSNTGGDDSDPGSLDPTETDPSE